MSWFEEFYYDSPINVWLSSAKKTDIKPDDKLRYHNDPTVRKAVADKVRLGVADKVLKEIGSEMAKAPAGEKRDALVNDYLSVRDKRWNIWYNMNKDRAKVDPKELDAFKKQIAEKEGMGMKFDLRDDFEPDRPPSFFEKAALSVGESLATAASDMYRFAAGGVNDTVGNILGVVDKDVGSGYKAYTNDLNADIGASLGRLAGGAGSFPLEILAAGDKLMQGDASKAFEVAKFIPDMIAHEGKDLFFHEDGTFRSVPNIIDNLIRTAPEKLAVFGIGKHSISKGGKAVKTLADSVARKNLLDHTVEYTSSIFTGKINKLTEIETNTVRKIEALNKEIRKTENILKGEANRKRAQAEKAERQYKASHLRKTAKDITKEDINLAYDTLQKLNKTIQKESSLLENITKEKKMTEITNSVIEEIKKAQEQADKSAKNIFGPRTKRVYGLNDNSINISIPKNIHDAFESKMFDAHIKDGKNIDKFAKRDNGTYEFIYKLEEVMAETSKNFEKFTKDVEGGEISLEMLGGLKDKFKKGDIEIEIIKDAERAKELNVPEEAVGQYIPGTDVSGLTPDQIKRYGELEKPKIYIKGYKQTFADGKTYNASFTEMGMVLFHEATHHYAPAHKTSLAKFLNGAFKRITGMDVSKVADSGLVGKKYHETYRESLPKTFEAAREELFYTRRDFYLSEGDASHIARSNAMRDVVEEGFGRTGKKAFVDEVAIAEVNTEAIAKTLFARAADPVGFNEAMIKAGYDTFVDAANNVVKVAKNKIRASSGEGVGGSSAQASIFGKKKIKEEPLPELKYDKRGNFSGKLLSKYEGKTAGTVLGPFIYSDKSAHPISMFRQEIYRRYGDISMEHGGKTIKMADRIFNGFKDEVEQNLLSKGEKTGRLSEMDAASSNKWVSEAMDVIENTPVVFEKLLTEDLFGEKPLASEGLIMDRVTKYSQPDAIYKRIDRLDSTLDRVTDGEYRTVLREMSGHETFRSLWEAVDDKGVMSLYQHNLKLGLQPHFERMNKIYQERKTQIAKEARERISKKGVGSKQVLEDMRAKLQKIDKEFKIDAIRSYESALRKTKDIGYHPDITLSLGSLAPEIYYKAAKKTGIKYTYGPNKGKIKDINDLSVRESVRIANSLDKSYYNYGSRIGGMVNRALQAVDFFDDTTPGTTLYVEILNTMRKKEAFNKEHVYDPCEPYSDLLSVKNIKDTGDYIAVDMEIRNREARVARGDTIDGTPVTKAPDSLYELREQMRADFAEEKVSLKHKKNQVSKLEAIEEFRDEVVGKYFNSVADILTREDAPYIPEEGRQPFYYPTQKKGIGLKRIVGSGEPGFKKTRKYKLDMTMRETNPVQLMLSYSDKAFGEMFIDPIDALVKDLGSFQTSKAKRGVKSFTNSKYKMGILPPGITKHLEDSIRFARGQLGSVDIDFANKKLGTKRGQKKARKTMLKMSKELKDMGDIIGAKELEQLALREEGINQVNPKMLLETADLLKTITSGTILPLRPTTVLQQFFQVLKEADFGGGLTLTRTLLKATQISHISSILTRFVSTEAGKRLTADRAKYRNMTEAMFGSSAIAYEMRGRRRLKSSVAKIYPGIGYKAIEATDMYARYHGVVAGDILFNEGYGANFGKTRKKFLDGEISAKEFSQYLGSKKLWGGDRGLIEKHLERYERLNNKIKQAEKNGNMTIQHKGKDYTLSEARDLSLDAIMDANADYAVGMSAWINFNYNQPHGMRWGGFWGSIGGQMKTFDFGSLGQLVRLTKGARREAQNKFARLESKGMLNTFTQHGLGLMKASQKLEAGAFRSTAALARFLAREASINIPIKVAKQFTSPANLFAAVAITQAYNMFVPEEDEIEVDDISAEVSRYMGTMVDFFDARHPDGIAMNVISTAKNKVAGPALSLVTDTALGIGYLSWSMANPKDEHAKRVSRYYWNNLQNSLSPVVFGGLFMGAYEAVEGRQYYNKNAFDGILGNIFGLDKLKVFGYELGEALGIDRIEKSKHKLKTIEAILRVLKAWDTGETSNKFRSRLKSLKDKPTEWGDVYRSKYYDTFNSSSDSSIYKNKYYDMVEEGEDGR